MKKGRICYEKEPDLNYDTGIAYSEYCINVYYDVQCHQYKP